MATFLENYLQSIQSLPSELKRNFALIGELDHRSQDLMDKIESYTQSYQLSNKRNMEDHLSQTTLAQIRKDLDTCMEYGDEKISIAVQTYDMVDKHIRRLDQDLQRFESELAMERKAQAQKTEQAMRAKGKFGQQRKNILPKPGKQKIGKLTSLPQEMPIDPNEPTYCYCGQVSFGRMVGCDNADCPIEWFHFNCVGLNEPIKGTWYCPECRDKVSKA
mmetsp:Transcript_25272/g.28103  ORF Transcript_25272/g.28103 Transcript_25272/m.28103 type:complete len:218 (+) Transcript_25272:110-763(+)